MKNNTLQLVTFSQAKKLKELGFDWDCRAFYDLRSGSQYVLKNTEPTNETAKLLKDCDKIAVLCPEIQLVFQWLRNKHKILVHINYLIDTFDVIKDYDKGHAETLFKSDVTKGDVEVEALTKALELVQP